MKVMMFQAIHAWKGIGILELARPAMAQPSLSKSIKLPIGTLGINSIPSTTSFLPEYSFSMNGSSIIFVWGENFEA